jgi:hypothetical protein
MQPPPPPTVGPITTPPSFRRVTGAHAIIFQIVLADLVGFLFWLLAGAIIGPPTWWIIRDFLRLFHASLFFDFWLLITVCCLMAGYYRRHSIRLLPDSAWAGPAMIIVFTGVLLIGIWLLKPDWIAIPARVVPTFALEPIVWKLVVWPQGATLAAILSLLAHLYVLQHSKISSSSRQLALSRAHPDGTIWELIERAYAIYRQNLARFDPPPISRLVTPTTFFYYQKQVAPTETSEPTNPEQEIYWRDGDLIINRAYIGTKDEQADILLPQLARQLYDCNTPDRAVERLFHMAFVAERTWLPSWILTIPIYVAQKCERHWQAMERERILDRDWFAYACGQGPLLRKWLHSQLKERTDKGWPDNSIPTLAERIDHLDSLITREKRQVQRLRDMLPPAPSN